MNSDYIVLTFVLFNDHCGMGQVAGLDISWRSAVLRDNSKIPRRYYFFVSVIVSRLAVWKVEIACMHVCVCVHDNSVKHGSMRYAWRILNNVHNAGSVNSDWQWSSFNEFQISIFCVYFVAREQLESSMIGCRILCDNYYSDLPSAELICRH